MTIDDFLSKYEKLIPIDIHNLHNQCAEQPSLCLDVGRALAIKKSELKRMKLSLRANRAELELDIREHPSNYQGCTFSSKGEAKITEGNIKAILDSDRELIKQERACYDLEKEVEELQVLYETVNQRKSMLKAEVELYVSEYFSEVVVKRESAVGMKKSNDALRAEIGKKRTRVDK